MNKILAIPLTLAAAATLAACGGPQPIRTVGADPVTYVTAVPGSSVRPGPGKIVVLVDPTGPVDGISWQRMTLRMNDGSMQVVDRRGQQLALGSDVIVR